MPEIAEVETVRNTLKKQILGKKIKKVNVLYDKMIESNVNDFKIKLIGQEFVDILRRGKWLIFETNDYYLLSHLRMEGKYFLKSAGDPIVKHEHVIFTFEDDSDLRYHDTRKFGRMNLINKEELISVEAVKKQGIEPGDISLTGEYLIEKLKNKRLPMKTLLLDQTIISGLGNIYADEVLFRAKVNPLKSGKDLSLEEAQKIVRAAEEVIKEAIEMGGTTIKSYTSSLGVTGRFQQKLMVHKREGEECKECGTTIKRIKVGGRSTYYCDNCQKMI